MDFFLNKDTNSMGIRLSYEWIKFEEDIQQQQHLFFRIFFFLGIQFFRITFL